MKYNYSELMKLLNEYTQDPYNHESCSYGRPDGPDSTCKECDCEVHILIEQFLLWIRDRHLRELK